MWKLNDVRELRCVCVGGGGGGFEKLCVPMENPGYAPATTTATVQSLDKENLCVVL